MITEPIYQVAYDIMAKTDHPLIITKRVIGDREKDKLISYIEDNRSQKIVSVSEIGVAVLHPPVID